MQSLLRWGIENSSNANADSSATPPVQRTDLDPGVIDAILGKPDSELMKEALAKAQDTSLDEDARITALDDLEMVRLYYTICIPHQHSHPKRNTPARREHRQCKWCVCVLLLRGEHWLTHISFLDLENLGMWAPLQGLLGAPSDEVKVQALWVIGTAMQNNPKAQRAVRGHPAASFIIYIFTTPGVSTLHSTPSQYS